MTLTAGHIPTPTEFNALDRVISAYRTSDATPINASTTLIPDTQIVLPMAASAIYEIRGRLIYTSGSIPDYRFGWTFPTGLTMSYSVLGVAVGTSVWATYTNGETDLPALEGAGTGVSRDTWLNGLVFVGSTPGNLILRHSQLTSNASDTVLKSNSHVILTRVS